MFRVKKISSILPEDKLNYDRSNIKYNIELSEVGDIPDRRPVLQYTRRSLRGNDLLYRVQGQKSLKYYKIWIVHERTE